MSTQTTPFGSGPSGASSGYITGYLLVATPAMPDERFRRTVIYMCRHDADGHPGHHARQPALLHIGEQRRQHDEVAD